ncbi:MAG: serine/threonine protein kinase [Sorangiineae bacterium PRO1]|nr:serine/threonine protein kinase [Sorangiineae bacterium PRO1]
MVAKLAPRRARSRHIAPPCRRTCILRSEGGPLNGVHSELEGVDPAVSRARQRTGTVLHGKWHLDTLLGVGGMAAVYAATHRNGTRAAVKVLHPELGGYGHVRSRFLKEGYVANKVDHPGVVRVLDDDTADDGSLYLVMDLLEGESLETRRLRKGGSLVVDEVLSVADQVLDVLAAAHAKGIVHRDIKPENVFLTRQGVVKVLDFGIARLRELSTASNATQAGTTMGTPAFMAPEHARGRWEEVDVESDLWSVGATMFTLATGKLVHEASTPNEQLVAAVTQAARPMREVAPETPLPLAEVIDKALMFRKSDRWPTAAAMQDAVRTAYDRIRHAPIHSYPPLAVPESVDDEPVTTIDARPVGAPSPTGSEAAVTSGRTGVPLQPTRSPRPSRNVVLAAAAAAGVSVLVVIGVGVTFLGSRMQAESPSLSASVPSVQTPAMQTQQPTQLAVQRDSGANEPTVAPSASTPVVSLTDLPTTRTPIAKPPAAGAAGAKPPLVPVAPQPKPQSDWKDKRR